MTSLDIITFKKTLEDYIDSQDMPKIVISMVLKEITARIEKEACEEAIKEAKEKENGLQS